MIVAKGFMSGIALVAVSLGHLATSGAQAFCPPDLDPGVDCGCVSVEPEGSLSCQIGGGDAKALQCCTADDRLRGALIEIDGVFVLDPAGPNGGYLALPDGSTVRSAAWAYGSAGDPCTLADPSAVIDGSLLQLTNLGRATVTLGASTLEHVRVTNAQRGPARGPCVDIIGDAQVRGVMGNGCTSAIRATDVTGVGIHATIEDSCSMNAPNGIPVLASDGFSSCPGSPFVGLPVTDDPRVPGRVNLEIRGTRILGAFWGLAIFAGLGASGGSARVVLTGTEIGGSSGQNVRVVGGQDAAPDACPGGNSSTATLILAEGNTIRNGGSSGTLIAGGMTSVGITIEGGVLGGGVGTPQTSSDNRARVVLGGRNDFFGNGIDILLLGNWTQNAVFPPHLFPVGSNNVAELGGNCPPDLTVEAIDCLPATASCPSTTKVTCPHAR